MDVFIFLTDIMAKPWYTHAGSRLGKVVDFAADGSETYPRVTDFVCRRGRRDRVRVPWEAIARLEKDGVYLREQESARLASYERRPGEILLVADLLDKQIVDVNGAKVERVNDIHLLNTERDLRVVHVETGVRGMFRRLGLLRVFDAVTRWLFDYTVKSSTASRCPASYSVCSS